MQEVALFTLPHIGEDSGGRKSKKTSQSSGEALSRKSSFELDLDGRQSVGGQQIFLPVTNEKIKCICSYQHDDGFLIECNKCNEWQHGVCMGVEKDIVPDVYECSVCMPEAIHLEIETAINLQQSFLKSYQKEEEEKDREKDRKVKKTGEERKKEILEELRETERAVKETEEKVRAAMRERELREKEREIRERELREMVREREIRERELREMEREREMRERELKEREREMRERELREREEKKRAVKEREEERIEMKQDNPKEKLLRLLLGWQDL